MRSVAKAIQIVVISLECIPIEKVWNHDIDGICPIKTNLFFYGTAFPHMFMEIGIVVLPLWKIRQLHLPRAEKLAVAGLFSSGIMSVLPCTASHAPSNPLQQCRDRIYCSDCPGLRNRYQLRRHLVDGGSRAGVGCCGSQSRAFFV